MSYANKNNRLGDTIQTSAGVVDRFKNQGYMRPNRFEILINSPPSVSAANKQVHFHVKEINLPDRSLRTVMNSNPYGPPTEMVQGQIYGTLNAVFYLSADMTEKLYFQEWQKSTFNFDTYDINYYKEYVGNIEIYTLDEQNKRRFGVKVHECYPDTISPIQLSQDVSTSVGTVSVGFKYRYFSTIGRELESRPDTYGATT